VFLALKDFQKKDHGELLILDYEKYISKQNGDLIWYNAQESVVGFMKN
jgi:hypothetical protein